MNPHLQIALEAWRAGHNLRSRRDRCKRYTFGDQWSDYVDSYTAAGSIPESEAALRSGFRPHTNNLIRQLVKTIVGRFRASITPAHTQGSATITPELDPVPAEIATRNCLDELDCRMLEEFLISGCAVQRIVTERRPGGCGVWIDNVSPAQMFVNPFSDPRGLDIELIGMLHSMSPREVLMRFAPHGGPEAAAIHAEYDGEPSRTDFAPVGDAVSRDFLQAPPGRCRVIELWTLESRTAVRCHDHRSATLYSRPHTSLRSLREESASRSAAGAPPLNATPSSSLVWHCRFLTPSGYVLQEFDSPYPGHTHPFIVKFYPLIDGEVHSLVEDILDQQRFVNRLITLMDHILSVSAKGALLMPLDSIPQGYSLDDIGTLWAQSRSIIPYRPGKGEIRQMFTGAEYPGAYRLLDIQMDLFQKISGVSGALQGQNASPHSSAALYDTQVQNSAVAILDLIHSFQSFRQMRNAFINKF